ncbi:peptidoglycan editing factor PgeF [Helicobacter anseris]|uniref:Purine nucleoside phosphorylase n=1 Tax=Helicobacter anseris TaxID=375926 RepID=A0A3D8J679_9HELI|nr:peptidoglycan editing factor PgeF [Helicobacter anseris]RDU72626.1 peptidoglycan editing factor PgeF [Helicobacter anseris]
MVTNKKLFFYSSKQSQIFKHTQIDFIVTSRENGFSKKEFSSFNLAYHVSDNNKSVTKNREKIKNIFHANKPLIWLNQIHSDIIKTYPNKNPQAFCQTGDAIICKDKKVKAMIMIADCIPVCIFDSKKNIFALIHAGREGLFKNIIPKTLEKMSKNYRSNCEDLLVFIGPCIQKCCYEIQADILNKLQELFPESFKHFISQKNNKTYLDLPMLLKIQLIAQGISQHNIEELLICTKEETKLFSYRKSKKTGRFALIASLK